MYEEKITLDYLKEYLSNMEIMAYDKEDCEFAFRSILKHIRDIDFKLKKKPIVTSNEYIDYVVKIEEPEKHGD